MVFRLTKELVFPAPELGDDDGLLAVGGDLSEDRLMLAYSMGIFPWYSDETPILWYAPHDRFVLFPEKVFVSKSMRKIINAGTFVITRDKAFEKVINACAGTARKGQPGTWITDDMRQAYINLHKKGIAHSIEVWSNDELAGGLYGVEMNNVFCGESMFSNISNASKAALIWLCKSYQYTMIDCQFYTEHLESMGAEYLSREDYMKVMKANSESL